MDKDKNHRDLDVWNKSLSLITDVYELTKDFPKDTSRFTPCALRLTPHA
jgi:hypothetical protein